MTNKLKREVKEMRAVYRDFLAEKGQEDESIVVLEADLSSSMSTAGLADVLGDRYVNVGIMEQQMIGAAAGMALMGYKPYIHTFGPFATRRVYDQVFLSLAYSKIPATIVGSDAGVTAEANGGTHMPFEELSLMRAVPGAVVYEVSDDVQFKAVLESTLDSDKLTYIRTIRKNPYPIYEEGEDFSKGYKLLREGSDVTIVASGILVEDALKAADELASVGINAGVVDLFRVKPVSLDLVDILAGKPVVTAENHNVIGGIGSAVSELMSENNPVKIRKIGVHEQFGQVGTTAYLKDFYKLSTPYIVDAVKEVLD